MVKRWYVYRVHVKGQLVYIGKGEGLRYLKSAKRLDGIAGIVRYFARETAAYRFERELIAVLKPVMNLNSGGGGSNGKRKVSDKTLERLWKHAIYQRANTGNPIDLLIAMAWHKAELNELRL